MIVRLFAPAAALLVAAPAFAQSEPQPAPSIAAAKTPICTDRPTKANAVCTVSAGQWQLESDAINWTRSRSDGTKTDVVLYSNPTLKFGLGPRTDIEASIAPYVMVRTENGGIRNTLGGVGDLYVRLKQQLTDGSGKIQVGVIPFVKAPTGKRGVGNRAWEGGVALPIVFSLPSGFTLNLGPEVDLLADGDGRGRHAQLIGVANLSRSFGKATVYAELWSAQNHDPAGTVRQYSADVAVAYLLSPSLQLDIGGNFGLNRNTPDAQAYFGLSTRL